VKILVLNGPNLNMLGQREPDIYGCATLDQIMSRMEAEASTWEVNLVTRQSNSEGELVTFVQNARREGAQGIILNPAAYTHTSIAMRDAVKGSGLPCVEIHISNTHARESFRQKSMIAGVCVGQIQGFGGYGYILALQGLVTYLKARLV